MDFRFAETILTTDIAFSTSITDIDLSADGQRLYIATGLDGGIASFNVGAAGTLFQTGAVEHRNNTVQAGGSGQMEWLDDGQVHGIYLGGRTSNLQTVEHNETGALERGHRIWLDDIRVDAVTSVRLGEDTFVFMNQTGTNDIVTHQMTGSGWLGDALRTQTNVQARIDAMQEVVVNDRPALLMLSGEDDSITLYSVSNTGFLRETGRIGAADGLGIADPSVAATAQVAGQDYILVGSPSSGTISVLSVTNTGGLVAVDHLMDTRDTRFGGIAALETVEHEGRTYVVAGGADDGLTLFAVMPGGRLHTLATFADDLQTGLTNVQALALTVTGAGANATLQIYVAGTADAGLTRMIVSLADQGMTLEAEALGGVMAGANQDDLLVGRDGDDRITGGAGDDVIVDGAGADTLMGGAGADTFIFTADGTMDRIGDFEVGQDRIDLSGLGLIRSIDQLTITTGPTWARIEVGEEVLHLESATGTPITTADIAAALIPGGGRSPILPRSADSVVVDPVDPIDPVDPENGSDCPTHDAPPPLVSGGVGVRMLGNAVDNRLVGTARDDTLDGGAGADALIGGDGIDTASYASSTSRVMVDLQSERFMFGDAVGDTYESIEIFRGGDHNDQLRGDAGDNIFFGDGVSDRLYGRAGDDLLDGGRGVDALYGNRGADTMTGGGDPAQWDRFIYFNASESTTCAHARDVITDFVSGVDRIEISRLDADLTQGRNQEFDFIGATAFSGTAGELRYAQSGGSTFVQADMTGDGVADFEIELLGTQSLIAEDFLL